jgi:hypothetical protein
MTCYYHPDREAVGMCVSCGKPVCVECKVMLGEKIYCNPCADKMFASRTGIGAPTGENTSGQGSLAVIPREIGGWNWGAFLLSWIWAVGNSVWIGLLALIPYAGFIMAIILGVKGNEWAWRYKRWDSVEHFKRTQSTWTKWGLGIVLGIIAFVVLMMAIAATA